MTISQRATDVLTVPAKGIEGARAKWLRSDRSETILNSAPQGKEVRQVVVDIAANSTVYAILLAGIALSYTSDATATKIEIAAGLALAAESNPTTRGLVRAVSDGIDTVTFTALREAQPFTLSDTDANLTSSLVIAAATADPVPFGRLCMHTGDSDTNKLGTLAASARFAAQVDTYVTTYVASTIYKWSLSIEGLDYRGSVTGSVDTATTLAAIAADITAIVPAAKVVATSTATTVVLTAAYAGLEFASALAPDNSGASVPATTVTRTASRLTSANRASVGVSLHRNDIAPDAAGVRQYAALEGVEVCDRGELWVSVDAAVTSGDDVYVELGASAPGTFLSATSATSIKLDNARYGRTDSVSGLTILELN